MKAISSKNISDQELIAKCVNGCEHAPLMLYKKFSQKMFGICLRYASDYHKAEDLLQEGFIKVFRNLQKFRGDGSFEGWMRRIFVNTAIEHFRKKVHLYPIQDGLEPEKQYYDDGALDRLMVDDILSLVQELSPGYRTVFNLYVVEGYQHKEISEKLGISEGTSKSQLARARYLLQGKLKAIEERLQMVSSS